jgi:cyclin-dependent kinase-like
MIKGCEFMHKKGFIHRDIKPENMLLSRNGVLKMCDFGFARELNRPGSEQLTEYVSTRWYRAPELLLSHPYYSFGVDIWAIGCIFVELVTGRALYMGNSDFEML